MNIVFDKLRESLNTNVYFTHTNVGYAEDFMDGLDTESLDKVAISITGDRHLVNGSNISKCLTTLLRQFGGKENFRILTGDGDGVESIVRAWCKKSGIEIDVYGSIEKVAWDSSRYTSRQDRDRKMVAMSHVVIVIVDGSSKECDFMYKHAINEGRFVTRRIIHNAKPTKDVS